MKRLNPFWPSEAVRDKLLRKHHVEWTDVEELFGSGPVIIRGGIDAYGERRDLALGRNSRGRYLVAVFVHAAPGLAKVITARDMSERHRRLYKQYRRGR